MKKFLLLFVFALSIVGCKNPNDREFTLIVASETRMSYSEGGTLRPYKLVKENPDANWDWWGNNIYGFEFEQGYECVLRISEHKIVRDGRTLGYEYNLIKVISKEKKDSQGLPQSDNVE